MNEDIVLKRRQWLLNNIDWLMGEVTFHRSNDLFLRNKKMVMWRYGANEGRLKLK